MAFKMSTNLGAFIYRSIYIEVHRKNTPFRFLDLPVELRANVYEYLLAERNPIHLLVKRKAYLSYVVRQGSDRSIGEVHEEHEGKWMHAPLSDAAILETNHKVYKEAIMILYGKNVILLDSLTVLHQLLGVLGPQAAASLKTLHIINYTLASAKNAATLLICASFLHSLRFSHKDFCPYRPNLQAKVTTSTLMQDFGDLIHSLAESHKKANLKDMAENIISLTTRLEDCYAEYDSMKVHCSRNIAEQIKKAIKRHLRLDEDKQDEVQRVIEVEDDDEIVVGRKD